MKTLLIFAASTVSASLLVPTLAEARTSEGFEQTRQIVRYDDLDLASAKGQATLDRRIANAARQVCGAHGERTINVIRALAINACVNETTAMARREAQTAVLQVTQQKSRV